MLGELLYDLRKIQAGKEKNSGSLEVGSIYFSLLQFQLTLAREARASFPPICELTWPDGWETSGAGLGRNAKARACLSDNRDIANPLPSL